MKITDIQELKGKLKTAARDWSYAKIDELIELNPRLIPISVYLRRGINNIIIRYDKDINKAIDNVGLFLCDETGVYDTDMIIDDLCDMFEKLPVTTTNHSGFDVTYGKGEVKVDMPGNIFMQALMGDLANIRLTADDLREIKKMFT